MGKWTCCLRPLEAVSIDLSAEVVVSVGRGEGKTRSSSGHDFLLRPRWCLLLQVESKLLLFSIKLELITSRVLLSGPIRDLHLQDVLALFGEGVDVVQAQPKLIEALRSILTFLDDGPTTFCRDILDPVSTSSTFSSSLSILELMSSLCFFTSSTFTLTSSASSATIFCLPSTTSPPLAFGHRAVEGFEFGVDVSHLDFGLVHVLLQTLAQLQEAMSHHIHVVPGGLQSEVDSLSSSHLIFISRSTQLFGDHRADPIWIEDDDTHDYSKEQEKTAPGGQMDVHSLHLTSSGELLNYSSDVPLRFQEKVTPLMKLCLSPSIIFSFISGVKLSLKLLALKL
ncbi:hypothetical protein INR49_025362 [Caranx melampygus]|nr:hypothetical protein INR49_025362 [Caranx melampygus]